MSVKGSFRRRGGRGLAAALALAGCLAIAPSTAFAGIGLGVTPTMPTSLTVGQTGLPASLTLTNQNTSPDMAATATVCNAGDPRPCPARAEGIILIPSCGGQDDFAGCGNADPGVFAISPTATGAAGTACAGIAFTTAPLNDAFGKVRFSPPPGTNVVLPSFSTFCRIDFTVSVLKLPTLDAQPEVAGIQTFQVAEALVQSAGTAAAGRGSSTGTTVNAPPPPPPPPPPIKPSSAPRGTARITGPSGCVTQNFNVTVTGRQIRRVTFSLDGKRIKTLRRPNSGSRYRLAVRPNTLRRGTHRIIARTTFTTASGTPSRSLRVVFQRCARSASAPQFTG